MKLYAVGPDTLSEYDYKNFHEDSEVIYWYERGDYHGTGTAIEKRENTYWEWNLGHCSCYGPTGEKTPTQITEKFITNDTTHGGLRSKSDYDYPQWEAINKKAKELWFNNTSKVKNTSAKNKIKEKTVFCDKCGKYINKDNDSFKFDLCKKCNLILCTKCFKLLLNTMNNFLINKYDTEDEYK